MSTILTWVPDEKGVLKTIITGPNATTVYTDEIPAARLPDGYITAVVSASSTLTSANTFDLYGSYDGTTFVKLYTVASSSLVNSIAGHINLEAWPALSYKIAVTGANNESGKEITFRIMSW